MIHDVGDGRWGSVGAGPLDPGWALEISAGAVMNFFKSEPLVWEQTGRFGSVYVPTHGLAMGRRIPIQGLALQTDHLSART